MGLHNQFLLGASYDYGRVGYASSSELGVFGPQFVVNRCSTIPADRRPTILRRAI